MDPDEMQSYAEQEQCPQHGGAEQAAAQRRQADRLDKERAGAGDPISGSDNPTHVRSRRHGNKKGRGSQ
jgi:hypothetical protein